MIGALGARVETIDQSWSRLAAWLPFSAIERLAQSKQIRAISDAAEPHCATGSVTSAGVGILHASDAMTDFGLSGNGVKIGAMSVGVIHRQGSMSSGDLPSAIDLYNYDDAFGDEGTAVMEIAYDVAPSSALAFTDPGASELSTPDAISWLSNDGAGVIFDDIYYYDEPVFEDGPIAQAISTLVNQHNRTYISAAGNDQTFTWFGPFINNGFGWAEFNTYGVYGNQMTLKVGDAIVVTLKWANKWLQATDDYDLYVYDSKGRQLAYGDDFQSDNQGLPYEYLSYQNTTANDQQVYIEIFKYSGQDRDLLLNVYPFPASGNPTPSLQFTSPNYSLWGHQSVAGVLAAGACSAQTPDQAEFFSAHGPTRYYTWNQDGTPNTPTDHQTMGIMGIDGVNTAVGQAQYFQNPFYGTSAAAPHVAGIAALLLQLNSQLTPAQVRACLDSSADKLSNMSGLDYTNTYGFGRANAYKAVKYAIEHFTTTLGGVGVTITLPETFTTSSGTTLTIRAGTTIKSASGVMLVINGQLTANGSSSQPIVFDKSGSSSWYGLVLQSGSNGSVSYCNFNNATVGVTCNSTSFTISNCPFRSDYFGIYCNSPTNGTTSITYNDIENCTNSGIYLSSHPLPFNTTR